MFNEDSAITAVNFLPLTFWSLLICAIVFISFFLVRLYHRFYATEPAMPNWLHVIDFAMHVMKKPILFLSFALCLYFGWTLYENYILSEVSYNTKATAPYVLRIIEYIVFLWIAINFLLIGKKRLLSWAAKTKNRSVTILLPAISNSLQAAIFLMMVNIFIPQLGLKGDQALLIEKFAKVMLISVIGWIFFQAVNVLEKFILAQYNESNSNFSSARKIYTQVLILKRVILTIAFVFTLGSCLMVFDSFKSIGTGLLTTAGIISAIGAFASQQSLSRLFAGLQIAFTQPVRIGDTVIIDKESGQVEEITLSYIVIKLWDLRRLIMPTDYFTSKGIQNLTRDSTQLLGTIFIYADYTLPIDDVRAKFQEFLESSSLWDKKFSAFQVTDLKETTMEIRGLMSAENSSILWNLRCEIREKLIKYIVQHYPQSLAKQRTLALTPTENTSSLA